MPDASEGTCCPPAPPDGANVPGWALRYARAGLRVLPIHWLIDGRCSCGRVDCTSPGKHPLVPHGKDDASNELDVVGAWWRRWPDASVAIRLPRGWIVLDIDPRNGGDVTLAGLIDYYEPLPTTLTARTGGGGLHIWLRHTGPVRGLLCRGVDVKTSTGYVVAPPSVHASGGRYEWTTRAPIAPAPDWVIRLLSPPCPPAPPARPGTSDRAVAGLVRTVELAPAGTRNARLYWAACRAHEHGHGPAVLDELRRAALSVGLTDSEVSRTIASAARTVGGVAA